MKKQGAQSREAGFTLVEALTAIVILIFGLMAVTNLMIVAASSNQIANQTTAAAAVASQVMETLKATAWHSLDVGGGLDEVSGETATPTCDSPAAAAAFRCEQGGPPSLTTAGEGGSMLGVGAIHVHWQIDGVAGNSQLRRIRVRAEARGISARRTRAEFETFRSCTSPLFDANGTCSFPPIMTPTGLVPSCCPTPP